MTAAFLYDVVAFRPHSVRSLRRWPCPACALMSRRRAWPADYGPYAVSGPADIDDAVLG